MTSGTIRSKQAGSHNPFRSVRRGRNLFQRKFTLDQGVGPRTLDAVGNVDLIGAGLADS